MKLLKNVIKIATAIFLLSSCKKETNTLPTTEASSSTNADLAGTQLKLAGGINHVYTLSNQTSGNQVLDYAKAANGTLTFSGAYATGGTGTGGGLGNQGAVILSNSEDDNVLLAVNAGSNSISSFKITRNGLQLLSTVSSGGIRPVSITQYEEVVYVLNAGGDGNISGFKLDDGRLRAINNSTRPLSSTASGAAEIAFVAEGKVLVVTEKATSKIITYTVNEQGIPGVMHAITSSSPTPFGFAISNNNIFVSEAAGGAAGASKLSSYYVNKNGTITLVKGSVGANQSAACWVVITGNGKYAYTTNTANNNLTNFNVNANTGNISVNTAIAATAGMGPIDAVIGNNSKFLYVLNSKSQSISAYTVGDNGALSSIQTVTGIPVGANGLASK